MVLSKQEMTATAAYWQAALQGGSPIATHYNAYSVSQERVYHSYSMWALSQEPL